MGGLAGGRVRSRNSRGIPKKKSCSLNSVNSALRVIRIEGKMTRRAFSAIRVIRIEGTIPSTRVQNFWGVFVRKTFPAQNDS